MEFIKNGAVILCTVLIVSEILVLLIPDGKVKNTAQTVIALSLMLCVINIFSSDNDFSFNGNIEIEEALPGFEDDFRSYLINSSSEVTESLAKHELEDICEGEFSVQTSWETDDNNVILKSVIVVVSAEDLSKISIIKSRINSIIGIVPEVKTGEF